MRKTKYILTALLYLLIISMLHVCVESKQFNPYEVDGVTNLEGEKVIPEAGDAGTAFLFITPDCPISNRYMPELNRIISDPANAHVKFHFVYVDLNHELSKLKTHAKEFNIQQFSLLCDTEHGLVKMSQASFTPEVAVFNADFQLVYLGRIDNTYEDFNRTRAAATEHDLRDIIKQLKTTQTIALTKRPAIGCDIPVYFKEANHE